MNRRLLVIGLFFPLIACQSAEPVYYNLSARHGLPMSSKLIIKVQRPEIDETIDRPQMAKQDSNMRMEYDNTALWAAPLDTMIERVITDDLQQRLPRSTVIAEASGITLHPEYLVDLSVSQFGINNRGQAVMEATWSINTPAASGKPHTLQLMQSTSHTGSAEATALSQLLARLSDQIVFNLPAPPSGMQRMKH